MKSNVVVQVEDYGPLIGAEPVERIMDFYANYRYKKRWNGSNGMLRVMKVMTAVSTGKLWIVDFDGTISPLAPDRSEASLDPTCSDLLRNLASLPGQYAAVLDGLSMEDLMPRITISGIIGSGKRFGTMK